MTLRRDSSVPSLFVGRDDEMETLVQWYDTAGLLTILGPPGVGKTRLARQSLMPHGASERVTWLDATHATDEDGLSGLLARELDVPSTAARAGRDSRIAQWARLGRGLAYRGKHWLVIDHLDGLAAQCAQWLESLCGAAPEARIVVTSRAGVPSEQARVLRLAPLDRSSAVRLLVASAPGYRPRDDEAPALASLVEQLDCLPLALELAARRLSMLGPVDLAARLEQRLDLLTGRPGGRTAALRDVIGSAWDALDPAAQRLLTHCAVFTGPFDLDAAEAVARPALDAASPLWVVDALETLLDRSLVTEQPPGPDGRVAFSLLESVRSFALEQATTADMAAARLRHATHYAETSTQPGHLDNLLSAYAYLRDLDTPEALALRCALLRRLDPLVSEHSPAAPRLARLDETLEALRASMNSAPALAAPLLQLRGIALRHEGRMDEAETDLRRALTLVEGEPRDAAELYNALGYLLLNQGRATEARDSFERARQRMPRPRDPQLEGRVQLGMGLLAHSQGSLEDAQTHYDAAAHAFRLAEAGHDQAETLAYLGALALQRGELHEARLHYADALTLLEHDRDQRLRAMTFGNLALVLQEEGRLDEATKQLELGLDAARHVGDRTLEGHLRGYAGGVLHEQGDLQAAQRAYEHAIAILRDVGDVRLEAIFRACLGSVHAGRGAQAAARDAFDRAEQLLDALGDAGAQGAVSIHRGQLLLARARDPNTSAEEAETLHEAVRDLCNAARDDALYRESDDLRFALRLLPIGMEADALCVERDNSGVIAFRAPDQPRQDVANRLPLRRLIDALLEARLSHPGQPVSIDALLSAGWPDERVGHAAGMNRLKVALATLRKLGLRAVLQRVEGGYLLDPEVPVRSQDAG